MPIFQAVLRSARSITCYIISFEWRVELDLDPRYRYDIEIVQVPAFLIWHRDDFDIRVKEYSCVERRTIKRAAIAACLLEIDNHSQPHLTTLRANKLIQSCRSRPCFSLLQRPALPSPPTTSISSTPAETSQQAVQAAPKPGTPAA